MTHLFRPADPTPAPLSPSWRAWRGLLYVVVNRWLALLLRLIGSQLLRRWLGPFLLWVGLVVQLVLVCLAGYLVDLSISLVELWAELARKHLEITM